MVWNGWGTGESHGDQSGHDRIYPDFVGRKKGITNPVSGCNETLPLSSHSEKKSLLLFATLLLLAAMLLRTSGALSDIFWVDEAESAINGLTILEHGVPTGEYLGIPIYENTLTEPWDENPEYEFRDSSYSAKRGVAVYHGWLPLYAIAASQALFGLSPDRVGAEPILQPQHGMDSVAWRTFAPRFPALVFSALTCLVLFRLMQQVAGGAAALAALTWFGLSGKTVWFGTQSRYYPMTLLMVTVVAWTFHRTVKRGDWASFAILGIAEGLLFHTHQLSALVFACAALFGLPRLMKHPFWLWKCLLAVSIAGGLTIPWALWTGFFDTASTVPKVFHLFRDAFDWVAYGFARPKSLLLIAVVLGVSVAVKWFPERVPKPWREAFSGRLHYYVFLILWMGLIYAAFHLLVPAASYFVDRLTLMLLMPFIMLLGLLIGDVTRLMAPKRQSLLAIGLSGICILALHRPALFYGFGVNVEKLPLAHLHTFLENGEFGANTRFYATPSNQLIYSYYFGMPIQSTVPVRKSFFDDHPGEVIIIHNRSYPTHFNPGIIWSRAQENGKTLTPEETQGVQNMLWSQLIVEYDRTRMLPLPDPLPTLNAFEDSLLGEARDYAQYWGQVALKMDRQNPIFFGVDVSDLDELWTVFFLRFSGYEARIGSHLNYFDRIQDAEVTLLPEASIVTYRSPARN